MSNSGRMLTVLLFVVTPIVGQALNCCLFGLVNPYGGA